MQKIDEIPKLNINIIKKPSNIDFITPRSNKDNNNILLKSHNNLLTTFYKFPPRLTSPFSAENTSPNKTFKINSKTNTSKHMLSDNIMLSSYKILDLNDFVFNERLKTSSTRYSEKNFNKELLNKLSKKYDKRKKKLKKNENKYNSLIKIQKDQLNEVTFIPSPSLLNTKKLGNKNLLNTIKKDKSQSQKLRENKKNNDKNVNINDENLPIFLRDKYNIKGTNIISPFCIKARDESLYKRIFYNYFKKPVITKKKGVDNKLNIYYAENEEKFKKKIIKINEKIRKKGKKEKNALFPNSVEGKLANIKHKIKFMKKIVDYAYPEMVLTRVREANKILEYTRNKNKNRIPYKSTDYKLNQYNKALTKDLIKSFYISKL